MEPLGLNMQTPAKIVLSAVLACLLLLLAGGARRLHSSDRDNHIGRDRHRVAMRLRRLRTDFSAQRALHLTPAASLPPDEDDDDDEERFRLSRDDTREVTFICPEETIVPHRIPRSSAWRPSALDQPLYQTLCTLLI
jgi:hypothetical protein